MHATTEPNRTEPKRNDNGFTLTINATQGASALIVRNTRGDILYKTAHSLECARIAVERVERLNRLDP